jgi:hypothetical protein
MLLMFLTICIAILIGALCWWRCSKATLPGGKRAGSLQAARVSPDMLAITDWLRPLALAA